MSNSMKGENKLGATNYRAWKNKIYLILEKNKVLDLVKGKVKKLKNESSDAKKTVQRNKDTGHDSDGGWNKG